jgi:IS5 family transposase
MMRGGSIVDATLISALSSTRNAKRERDPEMRQTKKGNEWHFGMKCHLGVDVGSGYVHSLETTSANISDMEAAANLLRKDDAVVYGDAGYIGIEKRQEVQGEPCLSTKEYRINRRRESVQRMPSGFIDWEREIERRKSSVRSKVEHPFLIIKRYFGFAKTVYSSNARAARRISSCGHALRQRASGPFRRFWC